MVYSPVVQLLILFISLFILTSAMTLIVFINTFIIWISLFILIVHLHFLGTGPAVVQHVTLIFHLLYLLIVPIRLYFGFEGVLAGEWLLFVIVLRLLLLLHLLLIGIFLVHILQCLGYKNSVLSGNVFRRST
jgi:hypothetical protein